LLYAAWNEFSAKRYEKASQLLDRRAREVTPTSLDWMLRARIAESQGHLAAALDQLKHISDGDPIGAQAWLKAGQIELVRHRARAAEAAFRHSLALDPDLLQTHRELAYLYAIQRRQVDCDGEFRALAERMALNHILAFAWCQSYCRIWDPHAGREVLSRFVVEDPDDRLSRLALASSLQLTSQFDEAEKVLHVLPDSDADARAMRIELAIEESRIATAEALANGGPAGHGRLNYLRGQLALFKHDPRTASAYFEASLRRDPENRDALHGLGLALRALGDPKGKEYLEVAARHDHLKRTIQDSVNTLKSDPKLFYKLGEVCESLNRRLEAHTWYRLATERDPLDVQARQALARLDRTGSGAGSDQSKSN
jgi:predicted Zn-dependent protease